MTWDHRRQFSLRAVGASTLLLTAAAIAGQGLSLGRELFIAFQVGLSVGLDALLVALVLPTVVAGVLTSGPAAALIPAYVATRQSRGAEEARRLAGAVLTWIAVVGIGLTAVMLVMGGQVISWIGPGLGEDARRMAGNFVPLIAPLVVTSALSGLMSAICQAEQRFRGIAASTVAGSLAALVLTVGLWNDLHLAAIALGMVGGGTSTLLVLIASAFRARILPPLTLRMDGADARAFGRHAFPLIISSAMLSMNLVADRAIASLIAPGAVSALRYADILVRTPISAIGPAWMQSLYPSLVGAAQQREVSSLGSAVVSTTRHVIAAFMPIAVAMIAVAPWLVGLAFGRGLFSGRDLTVISSVVAGFAPLIVITMVHPVLSGAHNARRRGGLLLMSGGLSAVSNLALNLVLGSTIGVAGIALSTSVTSGALLVFLANRLQHHEEGLDLRPIWDAVLRGGAAAVIPALPIALLAWTGFGTGSAATSVLALGAAVIVMAPVYLFIAARLGFKEPASIAGLAWRSAFRTHPANDRES